MCAERFTYFPSVWINNVRMSIRLGPNKRPCNSKTFEYRILHMRITGLAVLAQGLNVKKGDTPDQVREAVFYLVKHFWRNRNYNSCLLNNVGSISYQVQRIVSISQLRVVQHKNSNSCEKGLLVMMKFLS